MFQTHLKHPIENFEGLELNKIDLALKLAVTMTESAFGHEYTLMGLNDKSSYTERECILGKLENHKKRYFVARRLLLKLDPERLTALEEELQLQKNAIFREHNTVH